MFSHARETIQAALHVTPHALLNRVQEEKKAPQGAPDLTYHIPQIGLFSLHFLLS